MRKYTASSVLSFEIARYKSPELTSSTLADMNSCPIEFRRDVVSTLVAGRLLLNCYLCLIETTAKTGETCAESGVCHGVGCLSITAPTAKGNRMPPYDGKCYLEAYSVSVTDWKAALKWASQNLENNISLIARRCT